MKAISVLEPWAYCIFNLGKDVENRSWHTHHRGPLVICSSARLEPGWNQITYEYWKDYVMPEEIRAKLPGRWIDLKALLTPGMALGVVTVVSCQLVYASPWADLSQWNWVIKNPRPFANPFAVKGRLGLYDLPDNLVMNGKPQTKKEPTQ